MEQLILEAISRHMKDKKVFGRNQRDFTKRKSCLTNLVTFYNVMPGLVDKGRAVHIVYLDFSKAFDIASFKILIEKLVKYELDEQTVKWTQNWLNDHVQGVIVSGTKSS